MLPDYERLVARFPTDGGKTTTHLSPFGEPEPMPVGEDGMVLIVRPGPEPITGTWDFTATALLRVTGPITRQP